MKSVFAAASSGAGYDRIGFAWQLMKRKSGCSFPYQPATALKLGSGHSGTLGVRQYQPYPAGHVEAQMVLIGFVFVVFVGPVEAAETAVIR